MADRGLLDTISGFLTDISASRQAALGNPAPMQVAQEQQRQENLLNQLQSLSQQEMQGPFGQTLQRQLQFGDIQGAQKTLINLPKYKQAQEIFKNPKLGLDQPELESLEIMSSVDPEGALKLSQRMLELGQVTKRGREERQARLAKEERAASRKEALLPENVLAEEITSGRLQPNDTAGMLGVLEGKKIPLSGTPAEQELKLRRMLAAPKLKKLIKEEDRISIIEGFRNLIFGKPQAPAAAAPTPVIPTPAAAAPVRKYNPATGRVE